MLLATKWVSVFGPFRPIFGQETDPKLSRSHFFAKRIHQKKFQLKIPIFSKSDDDATWWPNSYKKILTCGQLRNTQRYQKYVWLVRAFFLEFCTLLSQQCLGSRGHSGQPQVVNLKIYQIQKFCWSKWFGMINWW